MTHWKEIETDYDFQSAQWQDEETERRVVIENVRGEDPDLDEDLYNVRVLGPPGAGESPQHELATEVSERAAHEEAIDYMGGYPESLDDDS